MGFYGGRAGGGIVENNHRSLTLPNLTHLTLYLNAGIG